MADQPHHDQRHSTGANYSTLEAVSHHPYATPVSPEYSTLEVSPRTDEGRFSTLPEGSSKTKKAYWTNYGQSPPTSPPTSPKVDDTRFSTLEAYQDPNTPTTPDKAEGGIGAHAEASSEPKKENWKRRRVCGIPLLFLLIGLVVVLAVIGAVVGGVVGSRKKNDGANKPTEAQYDKNDKNGPRPTVVNPNPEATATQTSNNFFTTPIVYNILQDDPELGLSLMQDSTAHNKKPDDGVFIGPPKEQEPGTWDGSQTWEMQYLPPAKASIHQKETGKSVFWLRLINTDLAVQINQEVHDSVFDVDQSGNSRKDIPLQLKPFNENQTRQMWYLGTPDTVNIRDRIVNVFMWDKPWTLGNGPDETLAMLPDNINGDGLWKLKNLTAY